MTKKIYYQDPDKSEKVVLVGDDFRLTEEEYLARRKKLKANNFVKIQNDPRVTRVGRIIRKYSIDELPQLINILKGDNVGRRQSAPPPPTKQNYSLQTNTSNATWLLPA